MNGVTIDLNLPREDEVRLNWYRDWDSCGHPGDLVGRGAVGTAHIRRDWGGQTYYADITRGFGFSEITLYGPSSHPTEEEAKAAAIRAYSALSTTL